MMRLQAKFSQWLVALLGILLAFCLIPMGVASAADTTTPIVAKPGETVEQNGSVNVSDNSTIAVAADDATVTIKGNVTTNGIHESPGIQANHSTVRVDGNVTTNGSDERNDGVTAADEAHVTVGNVTTKGYQSSGISADNSQVSAGDIITSSDESWGVVASDDAKVTVKNVKTSGARDSGGIRSAVGSTVIAENVMTDSEWGTGVLIDGIGVAVVVNGNVTVNGAKANGIELMGTSNMTTNGKVRVGGNVTSKQGYGAVIQLSTKDFKYYQGAPTLAVEGTLSGNKGAIAIIPSYIYKEVYPDVFVPTGELDLNLSHYDLPTIIVNQLQGPQLVTIVVKDADDNLVELTGAEAEVLRNAILQNIQYITPEGETQMIEIDGKTYTYTVAKKQTKLTHDNQATLSLLPPTAKTAAQTTTVSNTNSVTPTAYAVAPVTNTASAVSPQTSDTTNTIAWFLLMAIAGAAIGGVVIYRKKA